MVNKGCNWEVCHQCEYCREMSVPSVNLRFEHWVCQKNRHEVCPYELEIQLLNLEDK